MSNDRVLLWTVAGVHLLAAAATWYAEVPIASPIALALAACVAFALGIAPPVRAPDRNPSSLGRPTASGGNDAFGAAPDPAADRAVPAGRGGVR